MSLRRNSMKRKLALQGVLMFVAAFSISIGSFGNRSVAYAQDIKPQTVTYGEVGGEKLVLDVYQPAASDGPLPAVIVIHGGAGSFGDRSGESDRAQGLAANGYVAFNIDYRLLDGGKNPWPAQIEDAQLAVRWVRANAKQYNVDPDRLCSLGHSFGGELAALLGERDTPTGGDVVL
ncbi:MAG: alpha/beta hydrolase, partial [Chloroflexota bacterium]